MIASILAGAVTVVLITLLTPSDTEDTKRQMRAKDGEPIWL